MKCPRCHEHRIRFKETKPHGFTFAPLKVKYCIGCGWEKVVKPTEPYYDYSLPPCPDNCPECVKNSTSLSEGMVQVLEKVATPLPEDFPKPDEQLVKQSVEQKAEKNPGTISKWIRSLIAKKETNNE